MTSRKINHTLTFETEFVFDNMKPHMAELVANMSQDELANLCTRALSEGLREHFLGKVNAEATWGILRLAGE